MNKKIIVAAFVIGGSGVVTALSTGKPLTPVILGSYVLILVLSIADAFGGDIAQLAGGLAMVAMLYVLINQFPWTTIIALVQGKGTAKTTGTGKQGA